VTGLGLDAIRDCLDGATPSVLATCARDGTPNVTYLSQATYVDADHLALSFQFFSKTRANVLENPRARLLVWHPVSAAMYRLEVRYLRTETSGPVFERMRAMLAGIASHTGMDAVFRLRGADIYRVETIDAVPSAATPCEPARGSRLGPLRRVCDALRGAADLEALLDGTLAALERELGLTHTMILAHDAARARLTAVSTRGYDTPDVGSEVAIGAGVIGVAARERVGVRITHLPSDRAYLAAVREGVVREGGGPGAEVAWPGLARPGSQVAVPIVAGTSLLGVLFAESPEEGRFGYDDEDALAVVASHLAASWSALERALDDGPRAPEPIVAPASGRPAVLKHYREDDSVFLDDAYVIKGVAGAILWAMAQDHVATGRTAFTNRELRVDPRIPLPALGENLEARLVLLVRRLEAKGSCLRLVRVGRGRLRFEASAPLELVDVG